MAKKPKILLIGSLLIVGLSVALAGCGGRDITERIPDLCCGNLAVVIAWLAFLMKGK